MLNRSTIAIVYLSYHSEPYLNDLVSSLKSTTYPKGCLELVIVDNPHPEYGSSADYIRNFILPLSGQELPHVTYLPQEKNLGFSGGNNVGIKWALDNGFDYIFLHNDDGFLATDALEPLVEAMETDQKIGAAQSMLVMYPESDLYNSTGNSFHYLGFGFCDNLRVKRQSLALPPIQDIAYGSGAAILLRVDLLKKFGLWDEDFFMYHEDLEYSLRLKAVGYRIVSVAKSIFYHKYSFSRNEEKFYYLERNRFGVLLMFYKWPTLVLLFPIGFILELGMIIFAWQKGWLKQKMEVYKYWLKGNNIKKWLMKRKNIQALRVVNDWTLLEDAVGQVNFNDGAVASPLLKYIGNPLMAGYWWVAKRLIFW